MIKKISFSLPLIAGILWGIVGVFVRLFNNIGFDNYTLLETRLLGATIILLVGMVIFKRNSLKIKPKDIWLFIFTGLIGMCGLNYFYNEAIGKLDLSLAAVLLSLSPVFVMVFARIAFKESITKKKVLSVLLAIIGCILVSKVLEKGGIENASFAGMILGVAAAVFYALYSIISKIAMEKGYNVFTITFYSVLIGSILMVFITDWEVVGTYIAEDPLNHIGFMLIHSLCTSVLPYVLYTAALHYVDAGKVSIIAAGSEPTAAMVFGLIFFSEMPTVLSVVGLIVTIIAIGFICSPDKSADEIEA